MSAPVGSCPLRLQKAETVLRNRIGRISFVVLDLETNINTQAILRTAESLGVQHIINVGTRPVSSHDVVRNITKGCHAFLTISSMNIVELQQHCLNTSSQLWYITQQSDPFIYQCESNDEYNTTFELLMSSRDSQGIFYAPAQPQSQSYDTMNTTTTQSDPIDLVSSISPLFSTTTNDQPPALHPSFHPEVCSFTNTNFIRFPSPLQPPAFYPTHSTNQYEHTIPKHDLVTSTTTSETVLTSSLSPLHSRISPLSFSPVTSLPPSVLVILDPRQNHFQLQLLAHKHIYLPQCVPAEFTASNWAAACLDQLLLLCPEAVGDLCESERNQVRLQWYRRLATTDNLLQEFLPWAEQPQYIPLLNELRQEAIEKWLRTTRSARHAQEYSAMIQMDDVQS